MTSEDTPAMDSELEQLLHLLADAALTDEQEKRLAERLRHEPASRMHYRNYMAMIGSLQWDASLLTDLESPALDISEQHQASNRAYRIHQIWQYGISVAAALLLAIGTYWFTLAQENRQSDQVATLISGRATSERNQFSEGDRLEAGILTIDERLVNITFDSGASLQVAGPAELIIRDERRVLLKTGSLSVTSRQNQSGFIVETDTHDFVDLGTDFGVTVDKGQSVEVHVFDGEGAVVARQKDSDNVIPVLKNEAGRIEYRVGEIVSIESNHAKFPWLNQVNAQNKTGALSPNSPAHEFTAADPPAIPRQFTPIPADSRLVFLGDSNTDRETHLLLIHQAIERHRPDLNIKLFNAGVTFHLIDKQPGEFKNYITDFKATHAVLNFGSEIALHRPHTPNDVFETAIRQLIEKLKQHGVEPIIQLPHPFWEASTPQAAAYAKDYTRILRQIAREGDYRVADIDTAFQQYHRPYHQILESGDRVPNFKAYRLMAQTLMQAFGFESVAIDESIELKLLPGVIKHWHYRPIKSFLNESQVAALNPSDHSLARWRQVHLPKIDPFARRSRNPSHTMAYRDQARGFATMLNPGGQRHIAAMTTVTKDAAQKMYLNIGGMVVRVWLNGELIHDTQGQWLGWHAGRHRLPVTLNKGDNQIVLETGPGFFASLTKEKDWALR